MVEGLFRTRKVLFMKIKYLPLILSLSALLVACGGNSSSNTSGESKQSDSSSLTSEDSKESETSASSEESAESPVESGDSSEEPSESSVEPVESSEESSEEPSSSEQSSEEEVDWFDLALDYYDGENLAYSDLFPAEAFTDASLPEAPAFLEDLDYGFGYSSFEGDEETWKYALIVMLTIT